MAIVSGHQVGPVGYGLISITVAADRLSLEESINILHHAVQQGCTYWNAAEYYVGPERHSLDPIRRYFDAYPESLSKVLLNVKGCFDQVGSSRRPDRTPENVQGSMARCQELLCPRARIHQFGFARRDPALPLRAQVEELKKLVDEGKTDSIALSEVSADTIREAAKTSPISAVEIELSLFHPQPLTNGVLSVCYDLDITVIAYSPLGKGILTGEIKSTNDLSDSDRRRVVPRFHPENLEKNLVLVKHVEAIARRKGCTVSQIAIGWIIALSRRPNMPSIVPIPGTSSSKKIAENANFADLNMMEMDEIDGLLADFETSGDRYPKEYMPFCDS